MNNLIGYGLAAFLGLGTIALVFNAYNTSQSDSYVQQTFIEMNAIVAETVKTYGHTPARYTAAAITDATLIALGIAPESSRRSATLIENVFGGDYAVTGVTNTFNLETDDIPVAACVDLLTRLVPNGNIEAVRVGATLADLGAATDITLPVNTTAAATACATDVNAIRVTAG
ncbi:hypothetical protein CYMTET_5828 [Cymbomonas tetramitiformis]|uniref:Type 4 secretion system PilS N-terminal domain-containing protein n=1 Tax=Cymbomonas tetramitiformis TaxID=36881 RepID=A0AAE0GYK7_9CHLO|nr:hypothetical protein CYMTET_5828 [Cymbomonas tetramitiformis]|tara:strand:- start:287 stop:802 length:516 start_codon:yes stop_codon:yes gene_type:complete